MGMIQIDNERSPSSVGSRLFINSRSGKRGSLRRSRLREASFAFCMSAIGGSTDCTEVLETAGRDMVIGESDLKENGTRYEGGRECVEEMIPKNSETHLILPYRRFIFHGGVVCTYPGSCCRAALDCLKNRGAISKAKFDVARDTEV